MHNKKMEAISQIIIWLILIVAEILLCAINLVAAVAFMFTGGPMISSVIYIVFLVSLVCDPLAFVISIKKPKAGGIIQAASALFTLFVALSAFIASKGLVNIRQAILLGFAFWLPKLLFAVYFFQRNHLASRRMAFSPLRTDA